MTGTPWWSKDAPNAGQQAGANAPAVPEQRLQIRGRGAIGAVGDVQGNAIGPNSMVFNLGVQPPADPAPTDEDIARALSAYAERVRESYGRLDLEVLTPLSEQSEHPVVELREVFVPPHVRADPPPAELPRELLQRLIGHGEIPPGQEGLLPGVVPGTLQRVRSAYRERPPMPVLEVVAGTQAHRLVVLGDPGGGKSTLARYLALTLTQPGVTGPLAALEGRVPVVVELRRYAEERWRERTFEDFLDHLHATEGMAPPRSVMDKLLAAGRALVIFDGLDELFDPGVRAETARRIAGFASAHRTARVLVTSRVIGYQRGGLDSAGFAHHMLQDLTEREIGDFARRWYVIACPGNRSLAGQLVKRMTDAVAHSRPIRELAGNPLLLTILAIIGRRQTLPRDRQGVYRHAVTVLIAHWDQHGKHLIHHGGPEALKILGDEERLELLRLLARRMQDGDGGIAGNHIHVTELEKVFHEYFQQYELPPVQIAAATRAIIGQLRERNFILSLYGGEVYGFVHRTFLEYLAAADIAHRYTQDREWTPDGIIDNVFARRAADPAWHEVLLLVIGQLNETDAARAIDGLLDLHRRRPERLDRFAFDHRMLSLAVRALAEVKKIGRLQAQSSAVIDAIIELVKPDPIEKITVSWDWSEVTPALSSFSEYWTGRNRYLKWFHLEGQFLTALRTVGQIASALYVEPDVPAFLATDARNHQLRRWAVETLGAQWADRESTRILVTDRAIKDPDEEVRAAAVNVLAEHWNNDERIYKFLIDCAIKDPDEEVRAAAVNALAEHWNNDERIYTFFIDCAIRDQGEGVRAQAVRGLATYWSDRDDARVLIADRAVNDSHQDVRTQALRGLAAYCGDRDDARIIFSDRAINDNHKWTQVFAVQTLVERWSAREDTFALLAGQVIEDPDEDVRVQAVRGLAAYWSDRDDARALIADRAVNDPNHEVRSACVNVVAERLNTSDEAHTFLADRAINDLHHWVRLQAMRDLSERSKLNDETYTLLVGRVTDDVQEWVRLNALRILAERWTDKEDTFILVADRAASDPHGRVRTAAVNALAVHWNDREDTFILVADRAASDPDRRVRTAAVNALAVHWNDREEFFTLVADRATNDLDRDVRIASFDVLERYWQIRQETHDILAERIINDPDDHCRITALQKWAALASGGPGMCIKAIADESAEVREMAVQLMAFAWPTHPVTAPSLLRCSEQDLDENVRDTAVYALRVTELLASRSPL